MIKKTYTSKSNVSIRVVLSDTLTALVTFAPQIGGGSLFYTTDTELQNALERHNKYGKQFVLDGTQEVETSSTYPRVQYYSKQGAMPENVEVTTNKVTSLSSQSTNTQYPSAKCVYDNLLTKQNKETVVAVDNGSGETYENGITIELGKFYDFSSAVGTYTITLPANSATANGESTLVFATDASVNITIAKAESTDVAMIQSDFEFETSSTYEMNIKAINGKYYIVAVKEEVL